MIDPAEAVGKLILGADNSIGSFGGSSGWNISCGHYPDAPDTVILVNHTGGLPPMPKIALDEPSISILVRGSKNGFQAAKAKALQVKDKLLGMNSVTVGTTVSPAYAGDVYQNCVMISDVAYLGQDDNTRPIFSANFRFVVLPVPSGNRVAIS